MNPTYLDDALDRAAKEGHLGIVKYLFEHGAQLPNGDFSVLGAAIRSGRLDIVKFLVENGLHILIFEDQPLRLALKYNQPEIADYLSDHIAKEYDRLIRS